jgi:hypothetical protein
MVVVYKAQSWGSKIELDEHDVPPIERVLARLPDLLHDAARGPDGRSSLAVAAGRASGRERQDDSAWGLDMALRRWHGDTERPGEH